MELISEDLETIVDEQGEAGGPELNLGKQFSKQFTYATGDADRPYLAIVDTLFISAVDPSDDNRQVSRDDLPEAEERLRQYKMERDEHHANARSLEEKRDWEDYHPAPLAFLWREVMTSSIFTDLENPEETEIDSDILNNEVESSIFYETKVDAENAAHRELNAVNSKYIEPTL